MEDCAAVFFFLIYVRRWGSSKGMRDALATIPTIMMWDDHDIFDGFGSYPKSVQKSPIIQCIYRAARLEYERLQLRFINDAWRSDFLRKRWLFAGPGTSESKLT